MKTCKECKIKKPMDFFPDNTTGSGDGKRSQCKACAVIYQKNYRENKKSKREKEIRIKSRLAAKILFKNGFSIDDIAKIFNSHYYTAKYFIEN